MDKVASSEMIAGISIAIIYPFFMNKLVNKVTGYNDIYEKCYPSYITLQNSFKGDAKKDSGECDKELKEVELKKHITLLAIGVATVVASTFIQTRSTKLGVGFGGIFTIMTALTLYWNKYGENEKLAVSGVCLMVVIILSARLYSIKNVGDIFDVLNMRK